MTTMLENEWEQDCKRWLGRVLTGKHAHWCYDWDFLPVDETTPEYQGCNCDKSAMPPLDHILNEAEQ